MRQHKKGQTWSFDLLLGLTAFIIIFISIYGFINYASKGSESEAVKREAETLLYAMEGQGSQSGFIENNEISKTRLDTLTSPAAYQNIKNDLGLKYNFCIFFEDEQGKLLEMNSLNPADPTRDQIGIGDNSLPDDKQLYINDEPCVRK
jgi:hypothetical protein